MNGYYIHFFEFDVKAPQTGIEKKIASQIEVFNVAGLECSPFFLKLRHREPASLPEKVLGILPFGNTGPIWKYSGIFEDADYIYFRRPPMQTWAMRQVLKKIRQHNPAIKIVMEIPTYPYDQEHVGLKGTLQLIKDRYNRTRLNGLVDRLAVIGNIPQGKKIWNIPVIEFVNGVDVNSITPKEIMERDDNAIHLLCVAQLAFWHGYERLLEGLKLYYSNGGKRDIIVHLVGDGAELNYYQSICEASEIHEKVIFHGRLVGKALDEIYNQADIAVECLGDYKRDSNSPSSSLKSREYLAKGIPMICATDIDVFLREPMPYCLQLPNDATPINMETIISFYDHIFSEKTKDEIRVYIRDYALRNVDMRKTMEPIISYLVGE